MQAFDYTEEGLISGDVYDAIAKMRGHELAKVHEAINKIKEEDRKQREEQLQDLNCRWIGNGCAWHWQWQMQSLLKIWVTNYGSHWFIRKRIW